MTEVVEETSICKCCLTSYKPDPKIDIKSTGDLYKSCKNCRKKKQVEYVGETKIDFRPITININNTPTVIENPIEIFIIKNFFTKNTDIIDNKGYHTKFLISILKDNNLFIGPKYFNKIMAKFNIGTYTDSNCKMYLRNSSCYKRSSGYLNIKIDEIILYEKRLLESKIALAQCVKNLDAIKLKK